jgi:hypothetical protein
VKAPPKEPDPFDPEAGDVADPHPELAGPAGEDPLLPDPAEPVIARPAPVVAAPLDVPITNETCLGHLDEGIYLRDRGDMVGAVSHLRKALELAPDHPKLLYQLAMALDGMSQEKKAAVHWRQLRLLGQEAGNYYQMATERLKDGGSLPPPPNAPAEPQDEEKERRFVVGSVKVERLPDTPSGEGWSFSGRIDHPGGGAVDVSQVCVKLHLFDEVNGQRIDRIFGAEPPVTWVNTPVDWKEGGESFEFVFSRPPLSPDELVREGQRKYYGYAMEIRYGSSAAFRENKLQDIAAEPSILADLSQEMPEAPPAPAVPAGGEFFDPMVPVAAPGQPSSDLFPGDRMDR